MRSALRPARIAQSSEWLRILWNFLYMPVYHGNAPHGSFERGMAHIAFAPRREMHYDHGFLSGGSSVQAWPQLIPVNRELRNGIARQIARRVILREMCIIHASYSAFN